MDTVHNYHYHFIALVSSKIKLQILQQNKVYFIICYLFYLNNFTFNNGKLKTVKFNIILYTVFFIVTKETFVYGDMDGRL